MSDDSISTTENQETLTCALLFEGAEKLERQDLEPVILSDLFSEWNVSHKTLHFLFEKLRNEHTPPSIKQIIETIFNSAYLRGRIMEEWNLHRGYDHAKRNESQINRYAAYDLASRCIDECHACFKGLLDYGMVGPSFFCQTGHSFFWLAARSEKGTREQDELVEHLLSWLRPEDLLRPCSVKENRYSIFQISTFSQTRFNICLERLGPLLNDGLASLRPEEIQQICRYVDPSLADWLLKFGLDLGKPHADDAAPGWFGVVTRKDPGPMFHWLWRRGYAQPKGFVKYAASHNLVEAVSWIMGHDESQQDWPDAALIAAESTDGRSQEILKLILSRLAEKREIGQTLAENIVIKIVYGAYEAVNFDFVETFHPEIENVAIGKVQTLQGFFGKVDVVGMKIMAKSAGFSELAKVLEDPKGQA